MIIEWFLFLATFLIGYFLGQGKISKESIKEVKQAITKTFNTSRVGAIKMPTARDIYLKQHPILKEGMDEIANDLKRQGIEPNE